MNIVHVIDNNPILRECIINLLADEGLKPLAYDSALDFLGRVGSDDQACVVADMWMPDMTGIALLAEMKRRRLPIPVIIMSGDESVEIAVNAMRLGAADFLSKPFDTETLLTAIRTALGGMSDFTTNAVEMQKICDRRGTLTHREEEVLAALTLGTLNKVTAHDLGISVRTVEAHRSNLMAKMRAKSLSDLVRMSVLTEKPRGLD